MEQGPTMTSKRSSSPRRTRVTSLRVRPTTSEPFSLSGSSSSRIAGGRRGRMLSTCRSRVFIGASFYPLSRVASFRLSLAEEPEQPLADQAHHGRQENAGKEARQGQRPTQERRLVGEHPDRAHQRLGREQRDQRSRRGTIPKEIRRDGKEQVRPTRDCQACHPTYQDALRHTIRPEPAREHGLGDQDFEEAGEQEAEEQLEPHAPCELAACEQAAHGQRRVLGEGGEQSDEEKPGENPGADVHASCHVRTADRGARYSKPPGGAWSACSRAASMSP